MKFSTIGYAVGNGGPEQATSLTPATFFNEPGLAHLKWIDTIYPASSETKAAATETLSKACLQLANYVSYYQSSPILVIGGDQTAMIGAMSGYAKPKSIVWLTPEINAKPSSAYLHQKVLRYLLDAEESPLSEIHHQGPKINAQYSSIMAYKDLSPSDHESYTQEGFSLIPQSDATSSHLDQAFAHAIQDPHGFCVHIDASIITQSNPEFISTLCQNIKKHSPSLISITEYNPQTDTDRQTFNDLKAFLIKLTTS